MGFVMQQCFPALVDKLKDADVIFKQLLSTNNW